MSVSRNSFDVTPPTYPDAHVHSGTPTVAIAVGSFVNSANEADWSVCIRAAATTCGTAFVGIHPWFVNDVEAGWQRRLSELAQSREIGIGEIGLDKFRGPSTAAQVSAFEEQLEIAMTFNCPVSIHCVKRWGPLIRSLKRFAPFTTHVMIHDFRGSAEVRAELLTLGCFISFGFELMEENVAVVESWKAMPDARMLLESDAPPSLEKRGVTITDYGEKMSRLLSAAASLRGISTEGLANTLRVNARSFIGQQSPHDLTRSTSQVDSMTLS